ncbi:uncharacterized protein LOC117644693 [Thrips palmi]|uniref:Uncharacterized protein LOC117644693 n=1 Tax=Thrips palmi TaxID=161013 RepID=A0A6P8YK00_THRPL|nr:uncharacterized protein LOC117644693 [Thrips palmi]
MVNPSRSIGNMATRRPALLQALVVMVTVAAVNLGTASAGGRHARHLIFTSNNIIQLIGGFGMPVDLPQQAVTMGYVIKSHFMTPNNATQFTRPLEAFSSRQARAIAGTADNQVADKLAAGTSPIKSSRWHMYSTLQSAIEELGAGTGTGRQCLLRAVCEAAAFTVRHDGLLGEMLHVLLTPSSTDEPVLLHQDNEFHAAEKLGRQARSTRDPVDTCTRIFNGCRTATLDLFTRMLPY